MNIITEKIKRDRNIRIIMDAFLFLNFNIRNSFVSKIAETA